MDIGGQGGDGCEHVAVVGIVRLNGNTKLTVDGDRQLERVDRIQPQTTAAVVPPKDGGVGNNVLGGDVVELQFFHDELFQLFSQFFNIHSLEILEETKRGQQVV